MKANIKRVYITAIILKSGWPNFKQHYRKNKLLVYRLFRIISSKKIILLLSIHVVTLGYMYTYKYFCKILPESCSKFLSLIIFWMRSRFLKSVANWRRLGFLKRSFFRGGDPNLLIRIISYPIAFTFPLRLKNHVNSYNS